MGLNICVFPPFSFSFFLILLIFPCLLNISGHACIRPSDASPSQPRLPPPLQERPGHDTGPGELGAKRAKGITGWGGRSLWKTSYGRRGKRVKSRMTCPLWGAQKAPEKDMSYFELTWGCRFCSFRPHRPTRIETHDFLSTLQIFQFHVRFGGGEMVGVGEMLFFK